MRDLASVSMSPRLGGSLIVAGSQSELRPSDVGPRIGSMPNSLAARNTMLGSAPSSASVYEPSGFGARSMRRPLRYPAFGDGTHGSGAPDAANVVNAAHPTECILHPEVGPWLSTPK